MAPMGKPNTTATGVVSRKLTIWFLVASGVVAKDSPTKGTMCNPATDVCNNGVTALQFNAKTKLSSSEENSNFEDDEEAIVDSTQQARGLKTKSSKDPGSSTTLDPEQKAVFCYLKGAAGDRVKFEPPLHENATCAVVSSSGGLLLHALGADIDDHDVVFRFNDSPTVGFEQYVGHGESRDNHLSVRYGWNVNRLERGEAVITSPRDAETLQHLFGKDVQLINLTKNFEDGKTAAHNAFFELYPERSGQTTGGDEVTTGFHGMLIALSNCAVIDGYEITPSDPALDSTTPYNYYSGGFSVNTNSYHGFFKSEHDLWSRLTITDPVVWKQTGKTTYPGFAAIDCLDDAPFPGPLGLLQQN